jgi:hypothetical protein
MSEFQAVRQSHEYVQQNEAPPARVFPLFCPVREAEWVPGWKHRMIYSSSGVAELDAVFTTPNDDGSESLWICTEYEPEEYRIAYAWVWPGMVVTHLQIQLQAESEGETRATIRYTYTGLSEAGNQVVAGFDAAWFEAKMRAWEAAINHYLRTGRLSEAGAWA